MDGRGYYIRSREAGDDLRDIALDATIRKCAGQGRNPGHSDSGLAIKIRKSDLMRKVRVQKISNLLVFLVDLSWSMAVTQRMRATKEAILSILVDAYQSRDRVALVTFQKDSSKIVIPPTHSVMLAERSMKNVPIGGKTPLAAGLSTAHELMIRERRMRADTNQLLIVLTDGAGNVPLTEGGDPMEDVKIAAERIAVDGFRSLVINTEEITFGDGLANQLAKQLNAPCHLISNIQSELLLKIVRSEK